MKFLTKLILICGVSAVALASSQEAEVCENSLAQAALAQGRLTFSAALRTLSPMPFSMDNKSWLSDIELHNSGLTFRLSRYEVTKDRRGSTMSLVSDYLIESIATKDLAVSLRNGIILLSGRNIESGTRIQLEIFLEKMGSRRDDIGVLKLRVVQLSGKLVRPGVTDLRPITVSKLTLGELNVASDVDGILTTPYSQVSGYFAGGASHR